MLDISDGELSSICSRHKNTQAQAYQILNLWYKRSTSHHKRQDLLDALENASFFDAARRLVEKCIEHVYSLPLVAACPCVHPDWKLKAGNQIWRSSSSMWRQPNGILWECFSMLTTPNLMRSAETPRNVKMHSAEFSRLGYSLKSTPPGEKWFKLSRI